MLRPGTALAPSRKVALVLGPAVALFVVTAGAGCVPEEPPVIQPIAFNHQKHTGEEFAKLCVECHEKEEGKGESFSCTTCHGLVPRHASAGFPTVLDPNEAPERLDPEADYRTPGQLWCSMCHDPEEPKTAGPSATEAQVLRFITEKKEPRWRKVYRVPDHVFFSHRLHVEIAWLDCQTCHGAMAKKTEPPPGPEIDYRMAWCFECHEKKGGPVEQCGACHR